MDGSGVPLIFDVNDFDEAYLGTSSTWDLQAFRREHFVDVLAEGPFR